MYDAIKIKEEIEVIEAEIKRLEKQLKQKQNKLKIAQVDLGEDTGTMKDHLTGLGKLALDNGYKIHYSIKNK